MMSRHHGKYLLFLFFVLNAGASWAQAGLGMADANNFRRCPGRAGFEVKPMISGLSDYKEGSLSIDWGDGAGPVPITHAEAASLAHTYAKIGNFMVRLSGERLSDGGTDVVEQEVVNEDVVPGVGLGKPSGAASSCVGESMAEFEVTLYTGNSSQTTYSFVYGDGKTETYTQADLAGLNGKMSHSYLISHCEAGSGNMGYVITVVAENACGETSTQTVQGFYVYQEPKAKFNFLDEYGWPVETFTACVGHPFRIQNKTEPERGYNCNEAAPDDNIYTWNFQGGKSGGAGDTIVPKADRDFEWIYDKAGTYTIELDVESSFCGEGEALTKTIVVLDSVQADFAYVGSFSGDTLCAGSVQIDNTSVSAKKYVWMIKNVTPDKDSAADFTIQAGTLTSKDLEVSFGAGSYLIRLTASNDCSEDTRTDTLHVTKNSRIVTFGSLPDFCPESTLSIDSSIIEYEWVFPDKPETPTWAVTGGVEGTDWEWASGTGKNDTLPKIRFINHGEYVVAVVLSGVGCGIPAPLDDTLVVYDPEIKKGYSPDKTELCENDKLTIADAFSGVNLKTPVWQLLKSDETPAPGASYLITGEHTTEFTFAAYGDYIIRAVLTAECSRDSVDIPVTVHRSPSVKLDDLSALWFCPDDQLDLAGKVQYRDYNNTPAPPVRWSITPATGVVWTSADTDRFPKIDFDDPGTYTLKVEIDDVPGCVGDSSTQTTTFTVVDSTLQLTWEIDGTPAFLCAGTPYAIKNNSVIGTPGRTTYRWEVPGASAADYAFDNSTGATPNITFRNEGTYTLKVTVTGPCATKTFQFTVTVQKNPAVTLASLPAMCPDTLDLADYVTYSWNGSSPAVQWTVVTSVVDGYSFENGTTAVSEEPRINFSKPGSYRINAELVAVCGLNPLAGMDLTVYDSTLHLSWSLPAAPLCTDGWIALTNGSVIGDPGRTTFGWTVTGGSGASDYEFDTDLFHNASSADPRIYFHNPGSYVLEVTVTGPCATRTFRLNAVIVKDPEVRLAAFAPICPGTLDLSGFVTYSWNSNPQAVAWTVITAVTDGYQYVASTASDLIPRIEFSKPGRYRIQAQLTSAGCGGSFLTAAQELIVADSAIGVNILPDRLELGEDSTLHFTNTTTGESLTYHWSIVPASGFDPFDPTDPEPAIRFTQWGTYTVSVDIEGPCSRRGPIEFPVVVRGIPAFDFSQITYNLCTDQSTEIDLAAYLTCDSAGNDAIRCQWHISPASGYTFTAGSATDMYPKIRFDQPGTYTLYLESETTFGGVRTTVPLTVNLLSAEVEASATLSALSGCVDDRFLLDLTNTSAGDSLSYRWEITPSGWSGDLSLASPVVEFTEIQNYTVILKALNRCTEDTVHYTVRAYGKPEVENLHSDPVRDVCEMDYLFKGSDYVGAIRDNGDAITYRNWTVTPDGYTWKNGAGTNSERPDLSFEGGKTYQITGKFKNGCTDTVSVIWSVTVDRFEPVRVIPKDTVVCALTEPFLLRAAPSGGDWRALAGDVVREEAGNFRFDPHIDETMIYELEYTKGTLSCIARDTLKVIVYQLPELSIGVDREACLNTLPIDLTPAVNPGGVWSGTGVTNGQTFRPDLSGIGEFELVYRYGDLSTGCAASDSIRMTVHSLPEPSFTTNESKYCFGQTVIFTPTELGVGHRFIWDFGDGTPVSESVDAAVSHIYEDPARVSAQVEVISVFGCRDTSDITPVVIVALPPAAEFLLDKESGCGPLDVNVVLNAHRYVDTNLRFSWQCGNGMRASNLQPGRLRYPSTTADTTYRIEFSVYNQCDTTRMTKEIQVASHPKSAFVMMNRYECSPVEVPFVNQSTGTGNSYYWSFGDGTGTAEKEPDHTYYAEETDREYAITLFAENRCSKDSITQKLSVRPNSIRPLFSMDNRRVCAGQEVNFTNYSSDKSTGGTDSFVDYYWDFGDGTIREEWEARHAFARAGTYHVRLFLDNGCGFTEKSDSILVYAIPEITITGDVAQCQGVPLNFSLESSERLRSVEWNMGDDSVHDSQTSFGYAYEEAGSYAVTASVRSASSAGCPASTSARIEIWPAPDVRIEPLDTMTCAPFFYAPRIVGEGYFKWDYGTGEGLSAENTYLYSNQTGAEVDRWITAYVETGKGCKGEYKGHLRLYPSPVAAFTKEVTYGKVEKVLFTNTSQGFAHAEWTLPDGRLSEDPVSVEYEFESRGKFPVILRVENEYGCRDTIEEEYHAFKSGLYFPDTFIPHSENGQVNSFRGIGMGLKEYLLEIYDLYGNKIWESRALEGGIPSEGWDGTNTNGELLPQGVYMWRAKAVFYSEDVWTGTNNPSGQEQSTQGAVLLLRK